MWLLLCQVCFLVVEVPREHSLQNEVRLLGMNRNRSSHFCQVKKNKAGFGIILRISLSSEIVISLII